MNLCPHFFSILFSVWLVLAGLCTAVLAQDYAPLDLTRAVVVVPSNFSGPENKAIQMLIEEVEQRSQVRWSHINQTPKDGTPFIAVNRAGAVDVLPREGYQLKTTNNSVAILGNDARGVLFGTGHLLRTLLIENNKITLGKKLDLTTAPPRTASGATTQNDVLHNRARCANDNYNRDSCGRAVLGAAPSCRHN